MKKKWLAKCFQWKVNILVTLLVTIAVILTLSRILIVVLAKHPEFIEKWISLALKQSVQIQSIKADWAAFDPGITFNNVLVKKTQDQQSFIQMKRMTVSIDILRSVLHWKLLPGHLTIIGVNLDVNNPTNSLRIRDIVSSTQGLQGMLNWMLSEGNVEIKSVNIRYHSSDKKTYLLHDIHLRVKNNFFKHRIWGGARINTISPTEIRFAAKLSDIDFVDAKFNADIYLQLRDVRLNQWADSSWLKSYMNKMVAVREGRANLEIWANWQKTRFIDFQGRCHVKQAQTLLLSSHRQIDIHDMQANFIWYPFNNAIDLDVEHVIFSLSKAAYSSAVSEEANKLRVGPSMARPASLLVASRSKTRSLVASSEMNSDSPLLLKNLSMQFLWNTDDGGYHLSVPSYQFSLMGLKSRGEFYLNLPLSGKPTIDFLSSYQLPRFTQLSRFISHNDGHHSTLNKWLHQAFLKGGIPYAVVAYRGPIEVHPFEDRDAHLSAEFQVRHASLSYYFDWPILSSLNSNIEVNNRRINAVFLNPVLDGNHIDQLKASLDDFLRPVLNINGILHTNVRSVYKFIQDSPMALKKAPEVFPVKGPVALNLQMSIDFNKPSFPIQSQGKANIIDSSLQFRVRSGDSIVHFDAKGNMNLDPILQQSDIDLLKGISGNMNYHAVVDIYQSHLRKDNMLFNATFTTDMKGVTLSDFPHFLDKKAVDSDPLKVHIVHYKKKPIQMTLHYRHDVSMQLLASDKTHHIQLIRGAIYVGRKPSSKEAVFPGFVIYGKMAHFNWNVWKPFIMPFIHEEDGAIDIPEIFGLPLRYVEVQFDQLQAYHQTIKNMNFKLIPRLHDWMFRMDSPEIAGTLFIPNYSGGTWAGNLDHLFLPKLKMKRSKKKRPPLKVDPRTLPPVDIEIKQLYYGQSNYGHLALRMRPTKHGVSFHTFSITSPLFVLKTKGSWNQYQRFQTTTLSGYLQTHDLGQVLLDWDIKDTLLHGRGWASFQLSWNNAPNQMHSDQLNGRVRLYFHHGRILKMDESESKELSLGRIVNAFSLEELPRRLLFHFSDITAKGLEFHALKGDLTIKKGVCKMKNMLLDSPVAKLKISGVINIPRKYYNLDVSVSPYVTSSVPLIVGIAGGPIAGAIAWIVNKIAAPEIGKMIGFVYHAKGSWDTSKDQKLPIPTETRTL